MPRISLKYLYEAWELWRTPSKPAVGTPRSLQYVNFTSAHCPHMYILISLDHCGIKIRRLDASTVCHDVISHYEQVTLLTGIFLVPFIFVLL